VIAGNYAYSAWLSWPGSPAAAESGLSSEELQFASIYSIVMAVVALLCAIGSLARSRVAALVFWVPTALLWADWALALTQGVFSLPWFVALVTFAAGRATAATFRYHQLMKDDDRPPMTAQG
jgi:hypothetical protein